MRYDIIKTEKYLLISDDSEIKGYYYDEYIKKVRHSGEAEYAENSITKNIVAHLPLNGAPILDGVPVLPSISKEDDVQKLADEASQKFKRNDELDDLILGVSANSFEEGYNKAKEKYKYTEEDLSKAWTAGAVFRAFGDLEFSFENWFANYKESLQQPKLPIGFECETERVFKHNEHMEREFYHVPKTITNSEGRVEWVGKYIWE